MYVHSGAVAADKLGLQAQSCAPWAPAGPGGTLAGSWRDSQSQVRTPTCLCKKKKKKNVEKEHFDGLHFPWATSLSPGIDFSLPKECACGYNVGTKGRATGRQWRLFVPRTVWPSSAEEPAWSWSAVLICSGRAWCWSDARRTAPYSPKPNTVSDVLYIVHDWLSDLLTRSDLLASFFYSVMNLNSCLSFTKSTAPFHLYANSLILF